MARYRTDIEVALPASVVFAYLEDFSNAEDWDPGVAHAERLDEGDVRTGSRFALHLAVAGRTQRWVYTTDVHEAPHRVVFATSGRWASGVDDIVVHARGDDASTIAWDAQFALKGVGRIIDPLFQLAFDRVASAAVDGLRQKMRELEQLATR